MKKHSVLKKCFSCVLAVALMLNSATFAGEFELFETESFDEYAVEDFDLLSEEIIAEDSAEVLPELEVVDEPAILLDDSAVAEENIFNFGDDSVIAPAEDIIFFEDEAPAFEKGYVFVNAEASVYEAESTEKKIGSFTEKAIVYAVATDFVTEENDKWLKITFDTVEAKEKEEALMTGFVLEKDVVVLTDEEIQALVDALILDETSRDFEGKLLPEVKFAQVEEEAAEDDVVEIFGLEEEGFDADMEEEAFDVVEILAGDEEVTAEESEDELFDVVEILPVAEEAEEEEAFDGEEETFDSEETTVIDDAVVETDEVIATDTEELDETILMASDDDEISAAGTITIKKNPVNLTVAEGGKAVFSVEAVGAGLTYQWQTRLSASSSWSNTGLNGNKTNTLSFDAIATYNGRQYRCVVKDSSGTTQPSKEATLTIGTGPVITAQPLSVVVEENGTATFKVTATGTGLTYRWQTRLSETASWSNTGLSGYNTDTLQFKALASYDGRQFRCQVTNSTGTIPSAAANLTIAGLSIVSEPQSITVPADGTATFTVVADGNGLKYQWQTRLSATGSWSNTGLAGNKTPTLSFKALSSYNGRQYRCVVTDENGKFVESKPATLTIGEGGVVITSDPEDITVEENGTATFKVVATGTNLKYQWQTRLTSTGKWSNTGLAGNKTDTLSFKVLSSYNGRQYRCVVTDANGDYDESEPATLTVGVDTGVTITTHPSDVITAADTTATFKVVASGTGLKYQWQTRLTSTGKWSNTGLAGNKTATLSFKALSSYNGRQYRCVVTDATGKFKESNPATLTIGTELQITSDPSDLEVAADATATFKVVATGTGKLTYQWQTRLSSTGSWSNTGLTGNKTDTLSFKALSSYNGRQYRCVVKDEAGGVAPSKEATLTISSGVVITKDPVDAEVQEDEMVSFTITATGTGLKYQWQTRLSASGAWSNTGLTGNKTNTLSFKALASYNGRQYRCVVTDSAGGKDESGFATLTVVSKEFTMDEVIYHIIDQSNCYVAGYTGSSSSLTIPDTAHGLTVTEIGEEAFMGNTTLTSIDLPDTITIIRARAFKNCTNLSSMS